jgi:hypothetical protein
MDRTVTVPRALGATFGKLDNPGDRTRPNFTIFEVSTVSWAMADEQASAAMPMPAHQSTFILRQFFKSCLAGFISYWRSNDLLNVRFEC